MLGAYALALRFLGYLIHQPTQVVPLYRPGILINVHQPARYAIRKPSSRPNGLHRQRPR
ncbi:MAG: hypothetical protein JNM20_18360 [Rhizobiales bacterium]|nr:hypothetical protein [Hyphomicrobiales bacterium]